MPDRSGADERLSRSSSAPFAHFSRLAIAAPTATGASSYVAVPCAASAPSYVAIPSAAGAVPCAALVVVISGVCTRCYHHCCRLDVLAAGAVAISIATAAAATIAVSSIVIFSIAGATGARFADE